MVLSEKKNTIWSVSIKMEFYVSENDWKNNMTKFTKNFMNEFIQFTKNKIEQQYLIPFTNKRYSIYYNKNDPKEL